MVDGTQCKNFDAHSPEVAAGMICDVSIVKFSI